MGKGSSGIKSGGGSTPLARSLRSTEDRIRGNDTESAICMDEDGNILFDTSDGAASEVNISEEQMKLAYGKILTHNHPHGYYLSIDDINSAQSMFLKQVRATTPDGRAFVLERKTDKPDAQWFLYDYRNAVNDLAPKAANKVYEPSLERSEFNHRAALEHTKMVNEWLTKNATRYGYEFREERTK